MDPTLSSIIGRKVRRLRELSGQTQDEVASVARSFGLTWGRSTVAQLEDGVKRLSAEELLLLPHVLLSAFNCDTHLATLVEPMDIDPDESWVRLTPKARATSSAIASLLGGFRAGVTNPHALDVPATRDQRRAQADAVERLKGYRPLWPGTPLHRLQVAEADAGGEAEQKAARRLGVPAVHVAVVAHRLWGRGLTAERDARVGPGDARSVQAARGHITRGLLAELRPLLIDKED